MIVRDIFRKILLVGIISLQSISSFALPIEEEEMLDVRKPAQAAPAVVVPPAPVEIDWKATPPDLFVGNCQPSSDPAVPTCKLPFTEPNVIAFEDPKSCDATRSYMAKEISAINASMRVRRAMQPEATFPEACIVYALRAFDPFVYHNPAGSFGKCAGETGFPVKGNKIPCVTKDYARTIYNSFVDVTDCLAISQKELVPKLWNESAFHINSVNSAKDAWDGGVGQLTSSAIRSVLIARNAGSTTTELDYFVGEMKKSGKASCNRILAEPSAYQVVPSASSDRCGLLDTPANPLRNLLYMGIYYRTMVEQVTGITYRQGKEYTKDTAGNWVEWNAKFNTDLGRRVAKAGIKEKMQKLGIINPSAKYLRQILVTLGFNAGQDHAISLLSSYLDARIAEKLTLSDADLDFMNTDTRGLREVMVGPTDETPAQKAARLVKLDARRKSAHREPLPIYMRVSQTVGSPGYLSVVSFFRAKKYDRELGANVCTEKGFMQQSF